MKKIIIVGVVCFILGFVTPKIFKALYNDNNHTKTLYTITILADEINVRPEIDLQSEVITQVHKDEEYEVVQFHEGNLYDWYKIKYAGDKTGWIASGKMNAWVEIKDDE